MVGAPDTVTASLAVSVIVTVWPASRSAFAGLSATAVKLGRVSATVTFSPAVAPPDSFAATTAVPSAKAAASLEGRVAVHTPLAPTVAR